MICGLNFKEVIYKKSSRFVVKRRLSQLDAIDTYDKEDYLTDDECVEPYSIFHQLKFSKKKKT